jgi:DNA (cytosine-5)-methyltransferase 1
MEALKLIDFCAGIGAGHEAIKHSKNIECHYFSEIDKVAIESYKLLHGEDKKNLGDLRDLHNKLEDFDIMLGGFPCQSFSLLGKMGGTEDERGQIIFHLIDILREKQPKLFILENVKGFINHDGGGTLNRVIEELSLSNYKVRWKILSSVEFGIPQQRERIYFVGIRKDLPTTPQIEPPLSKRAENTEIKNFLIEDNEPINSKQREWFKKYLSSKYNCCDAPDEEIKKIENSEDYTILDVRHSDIRIYKRVCPTLRAQRHGIWYVRNKKIYAMTGIDSLRLQGFSETSVEKARRVPNSTLLKLTGNAYTSTVIHSLLKQNIENF